MGCDPNGSQEIGCPSSEREKPAPRTIGGMALVPACEATVGAVIASGQATAANSNVSPASKSQPAVTDMAVKIGRTSETITMAPPRACKKNTTRNFLPIIRHVRQDRDGVKITSEAPAIPVKPRAKAR